MKYSFGRKIQLDVLLKDPKYRYNSNEFIVLEADSPAEAEKAVSEWIKDWVDRTRKQVDKKDPVKEFEDSLN